MDSGGRSGKRGDRSGKKAGSGRGRRQGRGATNSNKQSSSDDGAEPSIPRAESPALPPASAGETPSGIIEPEEFLLTEEDLPRLEEQRKHATAALQSILTKDMQILQALPPVYERPKSHWDYVLDEVQWMSIDFRQELRWKTQLSTAVADVVKEKVQTLAVLTTDELREAETRVAQIIAAYESKQQVTNTDSASMVVPGEIVTTADNVDNVDIITERILALGAVNTYTTSAVPPAVAPFLFKHQILLFNEINRRQSQSLGTVVYGPSFSGKTATVAAMTLQWLTDAAKNQQSQRRPCAILVGNRKLLLRWMLTYIRSFRDSCTVLLYNEQTFAAEIQSSLTASQLPLVILVVIEEDLATVRKILLQQDVIQVCGTVIDLRSTVLVDKRSSHTYTNNNDSCTTKQRHLITKLSSFVMGENRMMVADEHIRNIDRLSAIALLVPSLPYATLEARFTVPEENAEATQEEKLEVVVPAQQDKVNRNIISQMLHNLSVLATIPADSSAIANAQVREEIVSFELLPNQQKKYDMICQSLVEYYDGSDVVMLAKLIALMKLTCFHSELVEDDCLTHLASSENQVGSQASGLLMQCLHHSNSQSQQQLALLNDFLDQSSKLKAFKYQLQRFDNLRRVIVASSWSELCLVHVFLQREKIPHLAPHLALQHYVQEGKKHQFSGENIEQLLWFEEEMNTQELNRCLSCVMLTLGHVFKSPSSSPWLAEAVIMLGYDWDEYMDIRHCFRMRLIEFRPSDPPVSVIRICAKGTVEEVMIKHKLGIPSLQGMKLSELNIISKSKNDKKSEEEVKSLTQQIFLLNAPILHSHNKRTTNTSTVSLGSPRKSALTGAGSSPIDSDSQNNSENDSYSSLTTRTSLARGASSTSINKAAPRSSQSQGGEAPTGNTTVRAREPVAQWLETFGTTYHNTIKQLSTSPSSTDATKARNEEEEFAVELQELLTDNQPEGLISNELFQAATNDIIMTIFNHMKSRAVMIGTDEEHHHHHHHHHAAASAGSETAAQHSLPLVKIVDGMQAACANALTKQEQGLFNSSSTPLQRIRMKQRGYGLTAKERRLQAFFLPNLSEALQQEHAATIAVRPSSTAVSNGASIAVPVMTVSAQDSSSIAAASASSTQGQQTQAQGQALAQQQQVSVGAGSQRPAVYQQFRDSIHEMMRYTHTNNTEVDPWLYTSPLYSATRQDMTSNMSTMHMVEVINDHRMQIVYKEKPVPPPAPPVVAVLAPPAVTEAASNTGAVTAAVAPTTSKSKKRKHSSSSAAAALTANGDSMPPPVATTSKSNKKQKTEGGSGSSSRDRNSSGGGGGGASTLTSNIIPASLLHPPKVQYQTSASIFPMQTLLSTVGGGRGDEGGTEMDLDVDEFGFEDLHADTAVFADHASSANSSHLLPAIGNVPILFHHSHSIVNASGAAQIGSAFAPPLSSRSSMSYDHNHSAMSNANMTAHSRYYVDSQNQRYTSAVGMHQPQPQQQHHMSGMMQPLPLLQQHHQLPAHRLPLGMTATQQAHGGTYMLPQQQTVRYVQSTPGMTSMPSSNNAYMSNPNPGFGYLNMPNPVEWTAVDDDTLIILHQAHNGDFSLTTAGINKLRLGQQLPSRQQMEVERQYDELSRKGQVEMRLRDATVKNMIQRIMVRNGGGGGGVGSSSSGSSGSGGVNNNTSTSNGFPASTSQVQTSSYITAASNPVALPVYQQAPLYQPLPHVTTVNSGVMQLQPPQQQSQQPPSSTQQRF